MFPQLEMMTSPFGIIFDLDGTLIDTVPMLLNLPIRTAQAMGINTTEAEQKIYQAFIIDGISGGKAAKASIFFKIVMRLAGLKDSILFANLLYKISGKMGLSLEKRVQYLKKAKAIAEAEFPLAPLFPGTHEILEGFTKIYAEQIHLGIVSTSSTMEIMKRFQGREEFLALFGTTENIIGRDQVKNLKPSPEGVKMLIQRWQLDPNRVIMVGDMDSDIHAGKSAGTLTVGISTGVYDRKQLDIFKPDYVFDSIPAFSKNFGEILNSMGE